MGEYTKEDVLDIILYTGLSHSVVARLLQTSREAVTQVCSPERDRKPARTWATWLRRMDDLIMVFDEHQGAGYHFSKALQAWDREEPSVGWSLLEEERIRLTQPPPKESASQAPPPALRPPAGSNGKSLRRMAAYIRLLDPDANASEGEKRAAIRKLKEQLQVWSL